MFGGNKPFGSTFGSSFGSTSAPGFGQQANAGFGSTPAFGTTGNMFGSATASQPATSNVFGAGTSGFGQSTSGFQGFGSPATTTSGGLFGSTTSFGSTPFGGGTSTSSSLFGTTQNQPKPFGGGFGTTSSTSTGLFGSSTPQQSGGLFGQTKPAGSLFGASSPGFGSQAGQGQGSCIKFNPTNTGMDTMIKNGVSSQVNTRHQTITLMKEYENKSMEEIRCEDYMLGRHKGQNRIGGGAGFGTAFGSPAASTTPSLFGSSAPAAGGGMFGQTQQKPLFGSTTTNTSTGIFGQQQQQPQQAGLFGTQNKPAFGNTVPSTSYGFGQTQPATSSGLFGQQNKPAFGTGGGLFGQTSQPTTSSFGSTSFNFGQTSQPSGGMFGSKPATGFGTATTAAPSFGFGQPTSQPSAFGSTSSSIFGKPATSVAPFGTTTTSSAGFGFGTSTSSFGTAGQTGGGLFGSTAKPAGFGGFGTTATQPVASTGLGTGFGGFGTTSFGGAKPGGLFGTSTGTSGLGTSTFGTGQGFGGSTFGGGTGGLFLNTQQPTTFGSSQELPLEAIFTFSGSPYGDSPLFRNLCKRAEQKDELSKPTSLAAQRAYAKPSSLKFRPSMDGMPSSPKPLSRRSLAISPNQSSLFEGLEPETSALSGDVVMRSARKSIKAFRPPDSYKKKPLSEMSSSLMSPLAHNQRFSNMSQGSPLITGRPSIGAEGVGTPVGILRGASSKHTTEAVDRRNDTPITPPAEANRTVADSTSGAGDEENAVEANRYPAGIRCTRVGYYTIPTAEELEKLVDGNGKCIVDGFTIGRSGYGSVYFPETFDVSGINIDEIVHIRRKEIVVYPDDEAKPPLDQGLNRRAEVTLDGCWPVTKTGEVIRTPQRLNDMRYAEMLEKNCLKMGAVFRDYRIETGSWVFSVRHFSKYGLDSDAEEACVESENSQLDASSAELKGQPRLHPNAVPFGSVMANSMLQVGATAMPSPIPQVDASMGDLEARGRQRFGVEALDGNTPRALSMERNAASSTAFMDREEDIPPYAGNADADMEEADYAVNGARGSGKRQALSLVSPRAQLLNESGRSGGLFGVNVGSPFNMPRVPAFFGDDDFAMRDSVEEETAPIWRAGSLLGDRKSHLKTSAFAPVNSRPDSGAATFASSSASSPALTPYGAGTNANDTIPLGPNFDNDLDVYHVPDDVVFRSYPPDVTFRPFEDVLPDLKPRPPVGYILAQEDTNECDVVSRRYSSIPVCWGPGGLLLHGGAVPGAAKRREPGFPFSSMHFNDSVSDPGRLVVERVGAHVELTGERKTTMLDVHESWLRIQLRFSAVVEANDRFPVWAPVEGVGAIHAHASNCAELAELTAGDDLLDGMLRVSESRDVWNLLVALWGCSNPARDSVSVLNEKPTHQVNVARKQRLGLWLTKVDAEVTKRNRAAPTTDKSKKLYDAIIGHRVKEANEIARETGDANLGQMLCMMGSHGCTDYFKTQLETWRSTGYDANISPSHLRVYCILAGLPIWVTSDKRVVNPVEGLDWVRSFALHLWYFTPTVGSIADALKSYEDSFRGPPPHGDVSPFPRPSHDKDSGGKLVDLKYHLLKLYVDRLYALEPIISPDSSTSNVLDFRMGWFMAQTMQSLGLLHLDGRVADDIVKYYASQLETHSLWHWAIFVLLHMRNAKERERACLKVLERNLKLTSNLPEDEAADMEAREDFIVENLRVSPKVLASVKATKAMVVGRKEDRARFLIAAGDWVKAHDLIMSDVAPAMLGNSDLSSLRVLLEPLNVPEIYREIKDWTLGGKLYLEFLNVVTEAAKREGSEDSKIDIGTFRGLTSAIEAKRWIGPDQQVAHSIICAHLANAAYMCMRDMATTAKEIIELPPPPSIPASSMGGARARIALLEKFIEEKSQGFERRR